MGKGKGTLCIEPVLDFNKVTEQGFWDVLLHYNLLLFYSSIILAFAFKYWKTFVGDRLEHKPKAYCISFLFSELLIGEIEGALNNTKTLITLVITALQRASAERFRNAYIFELQVA